MKSYIYAAAVLRSGGKFSVRTHPHLILAEYIEDFRPNRETQKEAIEFLKANEAIVSSVTDYIICFSMPCDSFERIFRAQITYWKGRLHEPVFETLLDLKAVVHLFDALDLDMRAEPLAMGISATPPPLQNQQRDYAYVRDQLGVTPLHAAEQKGDGSRVAIIDTGFAPIISETAFRSFSTLQVSNPILGLYDVCPITKADDDCLSLDGFAYSGTTITATSQALTESEYSVKYATWHPFFVAQGYPNLTNPLSIPYVETDGSSAETYGAGDYNGHGIIVASHALEVAPSASYQFLGYEGPAFAIRHVECLQRVVQLNSNAPIDVLNCSWAPSASNPTAQANSLAVQINIAILTAAGVTVVAGSGNGHSDLPFTGGFEPIVHPDVLSIGGALHMAGSAYRVSDIASSFSSFRYQIPQREVPDLVALSGGDLPAERFMSPTGPESKQDEDNAPDDGTSIDDAWCAANGTSLAAPQVTGIVALLKSAYPDLSPRAVKNILQNTCLDVASAGSSFHGDQPAPGWDRATGFGVVQALEAVNYLSPGVRAFSRNTVTDNGAVPSTASVLSASPDIINRYSPHDAYYLSITTKHRHDLSKAVELSFMNHLYLRVQNRGDQAGTFTAYVYLSDAQGLAMPATWQLIGQETFSSLDAGDFDVFGPLSWDPAAFTVPTDPQFIAVFDSPNNPMPATTAITTQADFENWVRNHSNVVWKGARVFTGTWGQVGTIGIFQTTDIGLSTVLRLRLGNLFDRKHLRIRLYTSDAKHATLRGLKEVKANQLYRYYEPVEDTVELTGVSWRKNRWDAVHLQYTVPDDCSPGAYHFSYSWISGKETVEPEHTVLLDIQGAAYLGNRKSGELHTANCPYGKRMAARNRVGFNDVLTAVEKGYDPCWHCLRQLDVSRVKNWMYNPIAPAT